MKQNSKRLLLFICILCTGLTSVAQEKTVTGTVTDENGIPLPGVNVTVKESNRGTQTDFDGEYSLQASEGEVLVFSFMGTTTIEKTVGEDNTYDTVLEESSDALDEVVVVGYGTTSKKNLTTAISQVDPEGINKAAVSNTSQLLLGRAAGLQATVSSPQPGGNVNISVRGGGEPLYVVDGVVMPSGSLEAGGGGSTTALPSSIDRGGLAGLNPEDIESIEILKDASASIYGIGAANGVVLITTKEGKQGKLNVSYNGSYSVVKNYDYIEPLEAQDYMGLVNSFSRERYLFNNQMGAYGDNPFDNEWSAPFTDSEISNTQSINWVDEILRDGSVNNHNVVVNGGSEKINYYLSGNYYDQEGTVANSGMERYTLRSNVTAELFPFLKLTSIANINRNSFRNSSVGGSGSGRGAEAAGALTAALNYPSFIPIRNDNGEYSQFINIPNAVALQDIDDGTFSNGTFLNFVADITLIQDKLNARLTYGNNKEHTRRSVFIPSHVYFDQQYMARGNIAENDRENQTFEATLSYNTQLGEFMEIDAVIGAGKYLSSGTGLGVAYTGTHDVIGNDNLNAVTGNRNLSSNRYKDERRSQFARANFDILDRYVVSATLRRDGTDKFFPEKKYALFPSVSLAWKMTNEEFLDDIDWLGLLKLRASYGVTGDDNLGTTLYGTYSPSSTQIQFDGGNVIYPTYVQNGVDHPNVSWEKTTMKNLGIDFYLLNDRLSGSFDIFQNDVTDLLGNANSPGLSMFGTYPINGGHIRRQGWDASLNSTNIQTSDFSWDTEVTLSRFNSLWIERFPNYDYQPFQIRNEEPTNARYYYETTGIINPELSNVPDSQPEEFRVPGFPIISDTNGDGEITEDDILMNNEVPDIYFGFGNTFAYKNFDLNIFLYSQIGVNRYNYAWDWAQAAPLANQTNSISTAAFDLFHSENNPDGKFPGLAYELSSTSLPGNVGTDLRFQDASFMRFRNITLGYNLEKGFLGDAINNMRIYVDAQNPITITNYDGFDPEIVTGGSYKTFKAEYPQAATYSLGVEINF